MGVTASALRLEMAFGGSWREAVVNSNPIAWWRFSEKTGSTGGTATRDSSGNGHHGGPGSIQALQEPAYSPEGGYSYKFDGIASGIYGVVGMPNLGTTFTIEAIIKPNSPSNFGDIAGISDGSFQFGIDASRYPAFYYSGSTKTASQAIPDLQWSHVAIVVNAGAGTFYINGVARGTCATVPSGFTITSLGYYGVGVNWFKGWMDEVVVYGTALSAGTLAAHYATLAWTDIASDLIGVDGIELRYGIGANGPLDRLSDLGIMTFTLRNDAGNSGGLAGYYSPMNTNCRSGFRHGTMTRLIITYNGTDYQRFMGRIASIDPQPGLYANKKVKVVVHDLMDELIEGDIRNITLQVNKTEAELLQTLFEALPPTAQPLAFLPDNGVDTIPYAFDDLKGGEKAIKPAADIVLSCIGFLHMDCFGRLRYENRQARQTKLSTTTFNDMMTGLSIPTTLDGVYNRVRATYHPKTIGASNQTVIWSQTGVAPSVDPGATIELWGEYYKDTDPQVKIGAYEQQALVSGTDYTANANADGSGANLTASIVVTPTFFASSVKFAITNNAASVAYITKLQCKGRPLYDNSPVTVESYSAQPYGLRDLPLDLAYQSNREIAQALADYLRTQYEGLINQAQSITFNPQYSDAFMLAALNSGIGDRITITESITGLYQADVFVQSINLKIIPKLWITCTLGLASASYFDTVWIIDQSGMSNAGVSTIFGFA